MLDRFNRQMRDLVPVDSGLVRKTATASLTLYEQVVLCDTTAGAITITLPGVAEAAGLIFSIALETDGGTNVTIQDRDESYGWSDLTLADAADKYLLYSDGHSWWTLASVGI